MAHIHILQLYIQVALHAWTLACIIYIKVNKLCKKGGSQIKGIKSR